MTEIIIPIIIGALVLIGCYIAGLILTKQGKMTIVSNTGDKVLIIAGPILFFVGALFFGTNYGEIGYVLIIIGAILLLTSIIFSIVNNRHNCGYLILSVVSKVVIFCLEVATLFLLLIILITWIIISFGSNNQSKRPDGIILLYNKALGCYDVYEVNE